MFRIRVSFNADPDPDPAFFLNADPDPGFDPEPAIFDTLGLRTNFFLTLFKTIFQFFRFFLTFNGVKHDFSSNENAKMVKYPCFIVNF